MKSYTLLKSIALVVALIFSAVAIGQDNNQKSMQEAAEKGKQDLLEILRSGRDLNLGVNAEELEGARSGKAVEHKILTFNDVQKINSMNNLEAAVDKNASIKMIVPFTNGNDVATVVVVAQGAEGYEVAGLGGASLAKDLSTVMKASGSNDITVYEVPNLAATIYAVNDGGQEMYYTSFQGNSLRRAVPASALFPALQSAAQKFQQQYGNKVKDQRLVK